MLHLVCLLHHLGSQGFQHHHPELLLPLPIMVCASGVINQDTVLGNATRTRTRINWPFQQLAVEATSPATTMPSLMVVFMPSTLGSMKLKTSLLL